MMEEEAVAVVQVRGLLGDLSPADLGVPFVHFLAHPLSEQLLIRAC